MRSRIGCCNGPAPVEVEARRVNSEHMRKLQILRGQYLRWGIGRMSSISADTHYVQSGIERTGTFQTYDSSGCLARSLCYRLLRRMEIGMRSYTSRQWQAGRWLADHPSASVLALAVLAARRDVLQRRITEFTFSDGSRLELIREGKQEQIRAYAPD